jgi:hypothetical protein
VGAIARRALGAVRQRRGARWRVTAELQRATRAAEADAMALFETLRAEVADVG